MRLLWILVAPLLLLCLGSFVLLAALFLFWLPRVGPEADDWDRILAEAESE